MTLFKNVEEIEILDMQELVGNTREIKSLDFKRIIKIDNDSEKEEFLADISSFANSVGGNTILWYRRRKWSCYKSMWI